MPKGKPKRKTKRKYTKKAQFINENNIKIVVNSEPKKTRRRRRRRRPKASIDRVNNLNMNNQLKPLLNNYPLSKQMFHQDKLTTDGLKESNIKTTEALKQLTNFMTTNMGRRKSYPSLEDKEEEYEDMKQLEDGKVDDDDEKVMLTPTPKQREQAFFTPSPEESDNEEVDTNQIEIENLWKDILIGKQNRTHYRRRLESNAELRKAVYNKAMKGSSKNRTTDRGQQINVILKSLASQQGAHFIKK